MEGIIDQLIEDIQKYFATSEEYKNLIVKEKYDVYPDISYPMVTIDEIENTDNNKYFDETERVTNLGYQFEIQAKQSSTKTAIKNVRDISYAIDTFLKGDKYRCLRRIGSPVTKPAPFDNNVMIGYLRYDCCLEQATHTIYRRN